MVPLTAPPGGNPNATAGIWSGVWKVTSPRAGTWTVTRVNVYHHGQRAGRLAGGSTEQREPGSSRTVTVTGTNVPRMSVSPSTVVWGSPQIVARVAVRDGSGNPVAGREVAFGQDNTCGADGDAGTLVATAANGVAAAVMDPNVAMCVYLARAPAAASMVIDQNVALLYQRGIAPRTLFRYVTAIPLRTSLPRRTTLTVTGSVNPSSSVLGYPVTVTLYKQVGVSSWKPVGSAVARSTKRALGRDDQAADAGQVLLQGGGDQHPAGHGVDREPEVQDQGYLTEAHAQVWRAVTGRARRAR